MCPAMRVEVVVDGNSGLSDADLAPRIAPLTRISSGPSAYYQLYEDHLDQVREEIEVAYYNSGYVEARLNEPVVRLESDRSVLRIEMRVEEGVRYRVGLARAIEVTDADEARGAPIALTLLQRGQWFSRAQLREEIAQIARRYSDHGHPDVDVYPQVTTDRDSAIIDIELQIHAGEAYVVDAVEVIDVDSGRLPAELARVGAMVGEPYVEARIERARQAIAEAHPDRTVEARWIPIRGEHGRALVRFVLFER
jgi:outer membrane protein insertion porin family